MERSTLLPLALSVACGCGWTVEFDRADDWAGEKGTTAANAAEPGTAGGGAGGSAPTVTGDTEPEGWTSEGVHTVTGPEPTSAGPEAPAPVIPVFEVSPNYLTAVGPVHIVVKAQHADQVRVELDGELLAESDGSDLEVTWEALSSDDNGDHRVVQATAEGPGGAVTREAPLHVNVPPSGEIVWTSEQLPNKAQFPERLAVFGDLTYIVGSRFTPTVQIELICLNAGKLVWSRTVDQWTDEAAVIDFPSVGTDVDVTPNGEILVSGNVSEPAYMRSYWARLTLDGALISQRLGNPGETAYAIAAGPDGEVVLGGSEPNLKGSRFRWWSFDGGDIPIGGQEVPMKDERVTDRVLAIDVDSNGDVWAAGDVGIFDETNNFHSPRAFIGHWTLYGAPEETWGSQAELGGPDLALDVVHSPEGPCIVGATTQPAAGFVRCFDGALSVTETRFLPDESVEARGVGRTRRGDVVIAATTPLAMTLVHGLERASVDGPPRWSAAYDILDLVELARALDCDAWGYCQVLIQRKDMQGVPSTVVLKLTP